MGMGDFVGQNSSNISCGIAAVFLFALATVLRSRRVGEKNLLQNEVLAAWMVPEERSDVVDLITNSDIARLGTLVFFHFCGRDDGETRVGHVCWSVTRAADRERGTLNGD